MAAVRKRWLPSCLVQVPNWSSLGRLKRSRFPNLGGGGQQFGGGAGPGTLSGAALAGPPPTCPTACLLACTSPTAQPCCV